MQKLILIGLLFWSTVVFAAKDDVTFEDGAWLNIKQDLTPRDYTFNIGQGVKTLTILDEDGKKIWFWKNPKVKDAK